MVQLKAPWIFIRGLTRGNGHWGDFPVKFQHANPDVEVEWLEIPGNGTSYKELTPLDPENLIRQLRQISKVLKNSNSVNICGVSLGGMIAMKWSELYPNEVHSVIPINTSFSQFSQFYDRLRPVNYVNIIRAASITNLTRREDLILKMTSNNKARADLFLNDFTDFSKANPFQFKNLIRQLILAQRIHINLPLKVPIKIIFSKNDRLVNPQCSIALSRKLEVEPFMHPTAGHDLPLDDPQWLIAHLQS